MLLNNVAPDCWLIVDLWWLRPVIRPVPCSSGTSARHFSWERQERSARWEGWSAQQCRGAEICALIRPTPCPFLSGALLPPSSPPVPLLRSAHMTEEPLEQLGLEILVSRTIGCPLSRSPDRPVVMSTDSQHQLIIATVAVKETHFGSDRLMTCKTCSYWVTNTSSRGSGCVTLALRTHYWTDNLTH